eukprot:COSAG05_NODE_259_length_12737_cov_42.436145_9_plen_121_part_00
MFVVAFQQVYVDLRANVQRVKMGHLMKPRKVSSFFTRAFTRSTAAAALACAADDGDVLDRIVVVREFSVLPAPFFGRSLLALLLVMLPALLLAVVLMLIFAVVVILRQQQIAKLRLHQIA